MLLSVPTPCNTCKNKTPFPTQVTHRTLRHGHGNNCWTHTWWFKGVFQLFLGDNHIASPAIHRVVEGPPEEVVVRLLDMDQVVTITSIIVARGHIVMVYTGKE